MIFIKINFIKPSVIIFFKNLKLNVMKKFYLLFALAVCLTLSSVNVFAQNVTVNPGAGSYPTLKDAFDAINAGTHTGAVIVDIVNSTTEPVRARLNASGIGLANYTSVNVSTSNASGVTVTGSDSLVIALMGTRNVIIDGRFGGSGRFISIIGTNLTTNSGAIWLSHGNGTTALGDSTGAQDNVIRNCNISAGVTQNTASTVTYGVIFSGHNRGVNGRNNDRNKVLENYIVKARYGVMINGGSSANLNDDNEISGNLIGPAAFGPDEIGIYGISVQFQNRCLITNNEVRFVGGNFANTIGGADRIGINLGNVGVTNSTTGVTTNNNNTVTGNVIHDIIEERTYSAAGIVIGTTMSGPKTQNLIANNVIFNVRGNGTGGDATFGILHIGGPGDKVIFNSVSLTGDVDPAGTGSASSSPVASGIRKHSAASAADTAVLISDNAIFVDISSNTVTLLKTCIGGPVSTYLWGTGGLNNNDYYSPILGTDGHVTGIAGTGTISYVSLALWQGVYTSPGPQDGASIQADPMFASVPSLKPLTGSPLVGAGAPKSPITTDIEGNPRSGLNPTIGAYENTVAPITDDVGITAASIGALGQIISVGKGYDLTATVKNFGVNTQTVVPVYYDVDGGSAVGPVNTVGPIPQNGTENVVFNGGFAFSSLVPGIHTVRVWTLLGSDQHPYANDTLSFIINVFDKITTFPHTETFGTPTNWTILFENVVGTTQLWGLGLCTNPEGISNDTAATSNCYNGSVGRVEILRSPEMDLTGMSNPVLNFYVAYRSFSGESDSMMVVLSTNGGLNFFPATTIYDKGNLSQPSLATLPPASAAFFPSSEIHWRHESISLANVAGNANVVIGFRSISAYGNRQWVDNVIVSDVNGLCTDNVTGPGIYNCHPFVRLDITATPAPGFVYTPDLNSSSSVKKESKDGIIENAFITSTAKANVTAGNQTDNPGGGVVHVSNFVGLDPGQTVATNTTATTPSGLIFTPSNIYHDYWFTVTYTGNDLTGYATYDILIDLDGLVFPDPNDLYIVKRSDRLGTWVCQNTTIIGNKLKVSGLTDFSDFAIAGDAPLPVELSSFTASVNRRDVTLNWTTATESNNSGFDIERSNSEGSWTKIGNVAGNGTVNTPHSYTYTDKNLNSGQYNYRLKQIDFNGNYEYFNLSNEVNVGIPTKYDLSQNYPNPFNPSTKINFDLPVDGKVSLKLFDMSGREVATLVNEVKTAGYYTISFNASNLSSGVYFYRLNAGDFTVTKKMMLVK